MRREAAAPGDTQWCPATDVSIEQRDGGIFAACFFAMASPCELLVETPDSEKALALGRIVESEARRIEAKFSRYRADSVVSAINRGAGTAVPVDAETAALIDYASHCHELSDGLFDITSGVLRRAWKFDGSDRVPAQAHIDALLTLVGFNRIAWRAPHITLQPGMEIDFGGFGKEYAVDCALALVEAQSDCALLVNFGGDLRTNRSPAAGPWRVAIERPDTEREARMLLEVTQGGLATSGDTHRYLIRDGVRYGHILDPRSGWPVRDAPRSVTVAASSCTEAGMYCTFAMLNGADAEKLLERAGVPFWCLR
jgi:thiamine biosynthesis lipoprotein